MKYLLDTNICVHFLRGRYSILDHIEDKGRSNCFISEVTKAELLVGVHRSLAKGVDHREQVERFLGAFKILPISDAVEYYAEEAARLQMAGTPIEDFDLLIGCTAVSNGLVMVSDNTEHLSRISGIRLENWIDRPLE